MYSSRRRILTTLGALSTAALAGCSESTETDGGGSSTESESGDTNTEPQVTETEAETSTSATNSTDYYVSPDGIDDNDGSQETPLATVNEGLNRAQPGDTIRLQSGEYNEAIFTVRDGKPDSPITVEGPEDAVIRPPEGTYSAVTIRHHHTHLRGITITGLIDPDRKFGDWNVWATNCVQINPASRAEEGIEYVRGAVVEPAKVGNTQGPVIQTSRIRDAVIGGFEVIGPAGMRYDPRVANHEVGHVREIVYVGSPADRHKDPNYPYDTPERTRNVRIHHIDNSAGYEHNEFVEIKPGCTDVTVEYCTDRNAGHNTEGIVEPAVLVSGNNCTVRWNDIGECPSPIGFNSWEMDGTEWGKNNAVYGNRIHGFAAGAFNFRSRNGVEIGPEDQQTVCGNEIERGEPTVAPWVPESNGFDGQVADRRGQDNVRITVGTGSDGRAFDPPVVIIDPGTTVTWEWAEGTGAHYIVSRVRVLSDPDTVPDPIEAPHTTSETFDIPEMYRYVCYPHHEEGMRGAVVVAADETRYEYAMGTCDSSLPEGDGIGHTAGDPADE